MPLLAWIVLVTLLGGAVSVGCAASVALSARATWVPSLVSYAIGALLGAAFLEILPHAVEASQDARGVANVTLAGVLLFFVLEKLVIWRHHHSGQWNGEAHEANDYGRSGLMILLGNTVHNLFDGVIISAAFLEDLRLGVTTGVAIFAHAVPQQVGDFVILLNSGYTRRKALLYSLLSSLATVLGGVLAYFALSDIRQWVPYLLGIAAASIIYVSMADLIPLLHRRTEIRATLQQVVLIGLGIGSIVLADAILM